MYIAMLAVVANIPNLIARYYQQRWDFFSIDLVIVSTCALIVFAVYKNKFVAQMQYVLAFIIGAGMVLFCMLGSTNQLFWMFPCVIAMFFLLRPNIALFACILIHGLTLPYLIAMPSGATLSYFTATIPTLVFCYLCARELHKQHANLNLLATEDFLTEAGNRRAFQQDADKAIDNAKRHNVKCSLLLFDMDHFKNLNDKFGHSVGDLVLKSTSQLVSKRLRRTDRLYRLGGEEFAIILNHAGVKEAVAFAQDLKNFIGSNKDPELPAYTVSIGLAQLRKDETLEDWMERTDKALYSSKENGRDQITAAH